MQRTLVEETIKKEGKKVLVRGWVDTIRSHGKLVFFDLRDRSGILQVVSDKKQACELKEEYAVEIQGTVKLRPKNMINEKLNHNLNDSGRIYLSHTVVDGKYTLRMVTGQTNVRIDHVEKAWELIKKTARSL